MRNGILKSIAEKRAGIKMPKVKPRHFVKESDIPLDKNMVQIKYDDARCWILDTGLNSEPNRQPIPSKWLRRLDGDLQLRRLKAILSMMVGPAMKVHLLC